MQLTIERLAESEEGEIKEAGAPLLILAGEMPREGEEARDGDVPSNEGDERGFSDFSTEIILARLKEGRLNMFEEAEAIRTLTEERAFTQRAVAEALGVSGACISNRLRLLGIAPAMRGTILRAHLTERHARALLRAEREKTRWELLDGIISQQLSAARAEKFITERISPPLPRKQRRLRGVLADLRMLENSLSKITELAREAGIELRQERREGEEEITFLLHLPKRAK